MASGLILGVGTLHLILYLFWRHQKSNFYYANFLLFLAAAIFFDVQQQLSTGADILPLLRMQRAALIISLIAGLFFFYHLFRASLNWKFRVLVATLFLVGIITIIYPREGIYFLNGVIVLVLIDICLIVYRTSRREGQWLGVIGIGFGIFALFSSYDLLLDIGLIDSFRGMMNAYPFGVTGLIISTSIYLAHDISITNKQLIERETDLVRQQVRQEILQQEVERTGKELEEARKLQLSMLPDVLPDTKTISWDATMRTAVEVGGDYYDIHQFESGGLTLVIGDATGHGNKAGFMVAIVKSLFKSIQPKSDFPAFFNRVSQILKKMNLGTLFMSLTCVYVEGNRLTISSAGMPPALIYRHATGEIEELKLKGMPLGAVNHFPYQESEIELQPSDSVLLLSDGLYELFNSNGEMFGWEYVKETFQKAGHLPPKKILSRLNDEVERWRGNNPINDDITCIALQRSLKADDTGQAG